ncbi:MAG: RNA-binding S4 domain-containing protein [Kiritimatiellia bacterium]
MQFTLKSEYIELCVLLKLMNLVQSGGEAKTVIAGGLVKVNGSLETRKRKKIYAGYRVEFDESQIDVLCSES